MAKTASRYIPDELNNRWIFNDDADPDYAIALICPLAVTTEAEALAFYTPVTAEAETLAGEVGGAAPP